MAGIIPVHGNFGGVRSSNSRVASYMINVPGLLIQSMNRR